MAMTPSPWITKWATGNGRAPTRAVRRFRAASFSNGSSIRLAASCPHSSLSVPSRVNAPPSSAPSMSRYVPRPYRPAQHPPPTHPTRSKNLSERLSQGRPSQQQSLRLDHRTAIAHPLRHPDHEILEWCRPALVSRGKLVLDLQRPRGAREHRIHRGSTIQRRLLFGCFRFPQRSPRACAPAPLRAQGGFVNVGFPYRDCSMRMPAAETPDGRSTCTTLWTWRMLRTSANWAISVRRTTSPPPRLISS